MDLSLFLFRALMSSSRSAKNVQLLLSTQKATVWWPPLSSHISSKPFGPVHNYSLRNKYIVQTLSVMLRYTEQIWVMTWFIITINDSGAASCRNWASRRANWRQSEEEEATTGPKSGQRRSRRQGCTRKPSGFLSLNILDDEYNVWGKAEI